MPTATALQGESLRNRTESPGGCQERRPLGVSRGRRGSLWALRVLGHQRCPGTGARGRLRGAGSLSSQDRAIPKHTGSYLLGSLWHPEAPLLHPPGPNPPPD